MSIKIKEINRDGLAWLTHQPLDVRIEMFSYQTEICRFMANDLLEEFTRKYAGEKYERVDDGRYHRHGYNRSTIRLGNDRVPIEVPRIMDTENGKSFNVPEYGSLKNANTSREQLLEAMLKGISCRDYEGVFAQVAESFGLSRSAVSQSFVEESARKLEEFNQRRLDDLEIVSLFVDGKYLAKDQIVIVLGVTRQGHKIPLGFIQTVTENAVAIGQLFSELIGRGLKYDDGLLIVIDGAKGLRKAVNDVFEKKAVVQRCQWHKRENVLSYLNEADKPYWKNQINQAYAHSNYQQAKDCLNLLATKLGKTNLNAAGSLREGLEETLTLHRLGINETFGRSFSTTNCIENLNSQLAKYIRKIKYWKNSKMIHRWIATALTEVEQKMRKVDNFGKLHELKKAVKDEINTKMNSPDPALLDDPHPNSN